MQNFGKRVWVVVGMGLLSVPLVTVGLAYACTGLATVSSNPGSGAPGSTVTVNGKGFIAHDPSDVRTSPAEIRLGSMDGPVLATASPAGGSAGGSFSVEMTVPQVSPGQHVLVVTQRGADGRPAYGTPARQAFAVIAPPPPAPAPAPALAQPAPLGTLPVAVQPAPAATPAPSNRRTSSSASRRRALARALASCNRRYSSRKAKTRAGKLRMAKRRVTCRSKARSALS